MPRNLAFSGLLLSGVLLLAARNTEKKPTAPALQPGDAQVYAQQLDYVITEVAKNYVRLMPPGDQKDPAVTPRELALAALEGLYEAAQASMPASLRQEVSKIGRGQALVALLARSRQSLGNRQAICGANALLASFQSMTRILDSYSVVVSGAEVDRANGYEDSHGIGLELRDSGGVGPLAVMDVRPGSPAQKAGIRPGDIITQINGQQADQAGWVEARIRLSDSQSAVVQADIRPSRVELTFRRPGSGMARRVILEPENFKPETVLGTVRRADNSWDYWVDKKDKIAHVRVARLARTTADELQQVLTALQAEGLRGLVLDLRWCPGGFLDQSVEVARLFLRKGIVAKFQGREETKTAKAEGGPCADVPMVVLVNVETSGGAELIAAALQDNQRAAVAGQRTVGKASVQTMLSLPVQNTYLKLTNGMFVRPSGKNLQHFPAFRRTDDWGVRPDPELEFRVSPELSRRLRDMWYLQTLRPGSSNEALALDDPEADPQRQAAVEGLRRMLR